MQAKAKVKIKTINYNLRIATWNANGLLSKIHELELFLWNEKIDVCLISESHLTKQSIIRFKGYKVYNTLHPSNVARGGSTILIKESIKHTEDIKIELDAIQVTTVNVQTRCKKIKISALYCPPSCKVQRSDFVYLFKQLKNRFIIGGDFNAKHTYWGSRLTTSRGKALYEAAREAKCSFQSTGKPTYWPKDIKKKPDLIDFFITKGLSDQYMTIDESSDLTSDHTPIVLTISETPSVNEAPCRLINYRTDWKTFRDELASNIELRVPIKTSEQLEEEVENFISKVQQAAWKSTPEKQNKYNGNNISFPLEVRQLVAEKRAARRKWQKSRAPQDKTVLNRLSNKLKETLKEHKNQRLSVYLQGLTAEKETDYSLWKAMKGLKRQKIIMPPLRKDNNEWARSDKEKAEVFAEHLEETFKPFPKQSADENIKHKERNDRMEIRPVTLKELRQEIKSNVNAKKAPGYDLITGQILKELPDKALVKLLHLINAVFRLEYVPRQWKAAEVIMIPKAGKDFNDKKSYRPISLLPIVAKVFEKLLLKRIKPLIEERNLIPLHQFGFRTQHSTIDQVHRIIELIEDTLEEGKVCSGIFLDVAQAFDKVWHRGLNFKLQRDLPQQFCQTLKSYLSDRIFRVKCGNEYSQIKEISAGVPQGSVLGPLLFLLYTSDLPQDEDTVIATFADDTGVFGVGDTVEDATQKTQKTLEKINNWTKKWRIQLNASKSVHVNFTNKKVKPVSVYINSTKIPFANEAKYLGMTLDAKLNWKAHIKMKKKHLDLKYRKMYWLLGRYYELSIHNKILLYKQVLRPVWMYGIQLWGCSKKSNIKIIQTFQNKVLRGIVKAPWFVRNDHIHKDLNMTTVNEEIGATAERHEHRLHNHPNVTVLQMLDNSRKRRRLKRTKPSDLVKK